jgi:hypothetical protein
MFDVIYMMMLDVSLFIKSRSLQSSVSEALLVRN